MSRFNRLSATKSGSLSKVFDKSKFVNFSRVDENLLNVSSILSGSEETKSTPVSIADMIEFA